MGYLKNSQTYDKIEAGPVGLAGALVLVVEQKAAAAVVDAVVGEKIKAVMEAGIEKTAEGLRKFDVELSYEDSIYLALGIVAGGALVLGLKGEAKSLIGAAKGGVDNILHSTKNVIGDIKYKVDLDAQKLQINTKNIPKVEIDKQGKHIKGHKNFIECRSELTYNNPQALIDKYSGNGKPSNKLPKGSPGYKERFEADEIIGIYKDEFGNSAPTNKGIIHYSKEGVHIIPGRP